MARFWEMHDIPPEGIFWCVRALVFAARAFDTPSRRLARHHRVRLARCVSFEALCFVPHVSTALVCYSL